MSEIDTSIAEGQLSLPEEVKVVNVGLALFGDAVRQQGAEAIDVEWQIPAGGEPSLVRALTRTSGVDNDRVERANREVLRRLDEGAPLLTGIGRASEVIPDMGERKLLHPGPALPWGDFCDPLRRSARVAVIAEGWAGSLQEADALLDEGGIELRPANDHGCVLPMATVLGPSAPVLRVENTKGGTVACSSLNQGPGQNQWFGVDAEEAVQQVVWLRDVAAPLLDAAITAGGPIDVLSFASQALQMGDDVHMRCQASTNLFIRHLLPHIAALDDPKRVEVASFLSRNYLFFLNVAMAAAKSLVGWAAQVEGSSIVTTMARNGTTFGLRLSGTSSPWFVANAPPVESALFQPSLGPEDAAPDIGDSAVLELVGLGGAAAAASPAVASFVGGTMSAAVAQTEAMDRICAGRSSKLKIPFLNLRGTPIGVDVRRAVEAMQTPSINTGILHSSSGQGQIGAGVARAPIAIFAEALKDLDRRLSES